ncbi:hypothetical protein [Amycolatopsis sp. H20-H5]|uniref:hypothetical protein n=1 Tax=Amycolatopsis sp. H20-H5 TaxID=3046309 RepID=UPI002DBBED52|nr:hypothetical protein [Amycolatopsis sp. H20-H5]MEC3980145.1 hypothetical protein [Amycolatopsis sp. H20-H5]
MGRRRVLVYTAIGTVVAGSLGWYLLWPLTAPHVDSALEDKAVPIIDARLPSAGY